MYGFTRSEFSTLRGAGLSGSEGHVDGLGSYKQFRKIRPPPERPTAAASGRSFERLVIVPLRRFIEDNGSRPAEYNRAFSHRVLRSGFLLPGRKIPCPRRIRRHRDGYSAALTAADRAWDLGHLDFPEMKNYLANLLARTATGHRLTRFVHANATPEAQRRGRTRLSARQAPCRRTLAPPVPPENPVADSRFALAEAESARIRGGEICRPGHMTSDGSAGGDRKTASTDRSHERPAGSPAASGRRSQRHHGNEH